ncbi:MAG TPA: hypothetical protein VGH28_24800 [Polyangiaceae bacterium]|jgi:hypothetical protein
MSFSRAIAIASVTLVVTACGNSGGPIDAGAEAAIESGTPDSGGADSGTDGDVDASTCTTTLCIHGDQPNQCPSCSPSDGDICSPPAAVTCNYSNGCSGAQEETRQCTCVLPDAGDAGANAIWSCTGSP